MLSLTSVCLYPCAISARGYCTRMNDNVVASFAFIMDNGAVQIFLPKKEVGKNMVGKNIFETLA